jgi:hypothetical protein
MDLSAKKRKLLDTQLNVGVKTHCHVLGDTEEDKMKRIRVAEDAMEVAESDAMKEAAEIIATALRDAATA